MTNLENSNEKSKVLDAILKAGIDLVSLLNEAHKNTLELLGSFPPTFQTRCLKSNIMSGQIKGLAQKKYSQYFRLDKHDRPYLSLEKGEIRIFFKKLDKKKRPNNVPTRYATLLMSPTLFEPGVGVTLPVYAGYQLNVSDWSIITGMYVVSMTNRLTVNWYIDVEDLSSGLSNPVRQIVSPDNTGGLDVKPKNLPQRETGEK